MFSISYTDYTVLRRQSFCTTDIRYIRNTIFVKAFVSYPHVYEKMALLFSALKGSLFEQYYVTRIYTRLDQCTSVDNIRPAAIQRLNCSAQYYMVFFNFNTYYGLKNEK